MWEIWSFLNFSQRREGKTCVAEEEECFSAYSGWWTECLWGMITVFWEVNCLLSSSSLPTGRELRTSHSKQKCPPPAKCFLDCGCQLCLFGQWWEVTSCSTGISFSKLILPTRTGNHKYIWYCMGTKTLFCRAWYGCRCMSKRSSL